MNSTAKKKGFIISLLAKKEMSSFETMNVLSWNSLINLNANEKRACRSKCFWLTAHHDNIYCEPMEECR